MKIIFCLYYQGLRLAARNRAPFSESENLQILLGLPGGEFSYRSGYTDGYYTRMTPIFKFIRIVDKGKIRTDAYRYCQKHNIHLDLLQRARFSFSDMIKGTIQETIFRFVLSIPWKSRVGTMELLRRLLISY